MKIELQRLPKVAICIPLYNVHFDSFINCIHSVLLQNYKLYDVLIYNDAATYENVNKYCEHLKNNKRIKYFKGEQNRGVSFSRNFLIDKAIEYGYDFVIFCDADDSINPNHVKQYVKTYLYHSDSNLIINYNILYKYSGCHFVQNEEFCTGAHNFYTNFCNFLRLTSDAAASNFNQTKNNIPVAIKTFISTKLLKDSNIRFIEDLDYGEDSMFVFSILYDPNTKCYFNRDNEVTYNVTRYNEARTEYSLDVAGSYKEHEKLKLLYKQMIYYFIKDNFIPSDSFIDYLAGLRTSSVDRILVNRSEIPHKFFDEYYNLLNELKQIDNNKILKIIK